MAQAIVRYMVNQFTIIDGKDVPLMAVSSDVGGVKAEV